MADMNSKVLLPNMKWLIIKIRLDRTISQYLNFSSD